MEPGEVIHLSVAIGRFFEALFFAILRVAGVVTVALGGVLIAAVLLLGISRLLLARRRR
jgi:hypothetical protein